jgi:hypothetical protein
MVPNDIYLMCSHPYDEEEEEEVEFLDTENWEPRQLVHDGIDTKV